MKISLVVRTLNEEKNISRCLSAVLKQTRLPDEILIVDNYSCDKTLEIVKKFQNKLQIIIFCNTRVSYVSGLNLGVKMAKYKTLGFLSADCFPQSRWLENLIKTMNKHKAVAVVGSERARGNKDIHYVLQRTRLYPRQDKIITFFENSNIIYKKEVLKTLLPFVGIGVKKGGEDTLLSIRYAKEGHKVMRSGQAIVEHNVYDSMDDFKSRTIQQGERLNEFFHYGFCYPRTYLNPFYWALIEFLSFFRYFDKRFLKISFLRLKYVLQGMLKKL